MCELLAVAWPEPRPLGPLLEKAVEVERLGIDGFGWGVAWIDAAGRIQGYRDVSSLTDDAAGREQLATIESERFLVHLRRPTLLSTIQNADTQPFVGPDGRFAFAHNGRFVNHAAARPRYADRLLGRADSEVGFVHFDTLLASSTPLEAMRETLDTFGGLGNLVYLGADGEIVALGSHELNPFWRFGLDGGVAICTACHSEDDTLFQSVFTEAVDRALIGADGETVVGAELHSIPGSRRE